MVSWDGEKPSEPKRHRPQKCTKTCLLSGCRFQGSRAKKGKIRYVLNGISEILAHPNLKGPKKHPMFYAQRGRKIAIWARHSVSTKPLENKRETARRVIWTHPWDQIPLLKRQNGTRSPSYSIYIYIYIKITSWSVHVCATYIYMCKYKGRDLHIHMYARTHEYIWIYVYIYTCIFTYKNSQSHPNTHT